MAGVIPIAKGGTAAAEASKRVLTGDIYVKRWQSVQGKGKKKHAVDHELHVNPLTALLAVGAAAGGAMLLGVGLWLTQRKVTTAEGKDTVLRLRIYEPLYGDVKVVDEAAYQVKHYYRDELLEGGQILHTEIDQATYEAGIAGGYQKGVRYTVFTENIPEKSHTENKVIRDARLIVRTPRGIPIKEYPWEQVAASGESWINFPLSPLQKSQGFERYWNSEWVYGSDLAGKWKEITVKYHSNIKSHITTDKRAGLLEGGL